MRLLLCETLIFTTLFVLLNGSMATQPFAQESALHWKSYPEFCARYGLGELGKGGMLRYRHNVDGQIVDVTLADWVTILAIGVVDDNGQIDRSLERVNAVVPVSSIDQWQGTWEECADELRTWIGKSHLPFEARFNKGTLFGSVPRSYFHIILEHKVIVIVDRNENVKAIQYLDVTEPRWVSLDN